MNLFKKTARHTTVRREEAKEAALILGWVTGIAAVDLAGGIGSSFLASKLLTMPFSELLPLSLATGPAIAMGTWMATWKPLMNRLDRIDCCRRGVMKEMLLREASTSSCG